jgi:hypothetical protein
MGTLGKQGNQPIQVTLLARVIRVTTNDKLTEVHVRWSPGTPTTAAATIRAVLPIQGERRILSRVEEGGMRVIGIMAAILVTRKLCQLESTRPSSALHSIIADAVIFAERIMQRIDAEWPAPRQSRT